MGVACRTERHGAIDERRRRLIRFVKVDAWRGNRGGWKTVVFDDKETVESVKFMAGAYKEASSKSRTVIDGMRRRNAYRRPKPMRSSARRFSEISAERGAKA